MAIEERLAQVLKSVHVPHTDRDVVAAGLITSLKSQHGIVAITVALPPSLAGERDHLERDLRRAIAGLEGVNDLAILFTEAAERAEPAAPSAPATPPRAARPAAPVGIKHLIAIGSGKGGVGKSTVAANLAVALANAGQQVGLLDADIYGPSVPVLMGVAGQKPGVKNDKLQPIVAHGVKLMSMGFLLPNPDDPVVWRGPMLASALRQLINDVNWGELDYLLVDLPPGTGDIPLSLVQTVPLTGAVIVITPQAVATGIGVKTLRMLQQSHAPILGIIENMSHFVCSHCQTETAIFDRGGGRTTAERESVPYLGDIPLDPLIRSSGDLGCPVVADDPASPQSQAFRRVAQNLLAQVAALARPVAPN